MNIMEIDQLTKLKIVELRRLLKLHGLSTSGLRSQLVIRLETALSHKRKDRYRDNPDIKNVQCSTYASKMEHVRSVARRIFSSRETNSSPPMTVHTIDLKTYYVPLESCTDLACVEILDVSTADTYLIKMESPHEVKLDKYLAERYYGNLAPPSVNPTAFRRKSIRIPSFKLKSTVGVTILVTVRLSFCFFVM